MGTHPPQRPPSSGIINTSNLSVEPDQAHSWMVRNYPGCPWGRYADDAVVHCVSKRQAEQVLAAIAERMEEVGLRLHPDKTRIVYCKDGRRRGDHEHTIFTFLGFTFRPRRAQGGRDGGFFVGFLPAMSTEALKAKSAELRAMRIHRRTTHSLDDLARWLNPIVGGWMNYYGRFYRSAMNPLLQRVSAYLRCPWPDLSPRFWPPEVLTPQIGCSVLAQRRSASFLTRFLHSE
jgi:hypothetical protein